jgi:antagonist of KipI
MSIYVSKPGLLTSVQDNGRYGLQRYGISIGGVMDRQAHHRANLIVGNRSSAPTLEITMAGPTLLIEEPIIIALCGADMSAHVKGLTIPMNRPVVVKKNEIIHFQSASSGCRAYLAVLGGIDVPRVMNGYGTYLVAGIGGYEGRVVQLGDRLLIGNMDKGQTAEWAKRLHAEALASTSPFWAPRWYVNTNMPSVSSQSITIRVMAGREWGAFSKESQRRFYLEPYSIKPQSNRMGYRLHGFQLHQDQDKAIEMVSEAITAGTIQVPPNGYPIVLMADSQTIGGYPRLAHVITVDLPLLAQCQPGATIRFKQVSLEEAQELYRNMRRSTQQLAVGLDLKRRL